MSHSIASSLAGVACALAAACVHGQQLEPRAYSNVPVGINFAVAGLSHSSGDVLPDPSVPARDAAAKVNGLFAAYSRALDLWGKSGLVTVAAPWATGTVSGVLEGQPASVERAGFGDPSLKLSMNFLGAPALSLKEFASYRQETIVGGSLQVTAPLGSYDPARIVNVGTNRWTLKPELGISRALGRWVLEGALAVSLFTDNREYQVNRTRAQEPLYSAQAHLVYNFRPGMWGAINYTFYAGGRSSVDGVARDDRIQSSRWGLTLTFPLDPRNSVKVYASTGVLARAGTDFDMAGIAFQHRWGGGL
jgi:hypothetical protein